MTVNWTRGMNAPFKDTVCAFLGRIWNTCSVRRPAVGEKLDCGWTWRVKSPQHAHAHFVTLMWTCPSCSVTKITLDNPKVPNMPPILTYIPKNNILCNWCCLVSDLRYSYLLTPKQSSVITTQYVWFEHTTKTNCFSAAAFSRSPRVQVHVRIQLQPWQRASTRGIPGIRTSWKHFDNLCVFMYVHACTSVSKKTRQKAPYGPN